jgi:hypothetical protein
LLICLELKNPVFMELLFVLLFNHLNIILQFYFILFL